MEIKLDKTYPLPANAARAWALLSDVRSTAACMPGAQITEQVDDTHYKGTVRSKVGPAVMSFGGDIEVLGLDTQARELRMLGKGADRSGSAASMQLTARVVEGDTAATSMLSGQATIVVSGKLAQFGSRLLGPVSDALLAQFADNFRAALARAEPVAGGEAPAGPATRGSEPTEPAVPARASGATAASSPAPAPASASELNALALAWTVFRRWISRLFGR